MRGTKLQVLQKLHNRAARIVTNSRYDFSASALIKTLNWPTVADMIQVETTCMVYKSINELAPDYLSEIFTKKSACSREHLRNTATDLQIPLVKTCSGQRTFSYRGARIWNHLDLEVKQMSSFNQQSAIYIVPNLTKTVGLLSTKYAYANMEQKHYL